MGYFIMFSSNVATTGTYSQGNYAAGSTFRDAFALNLSSKGCPVRSLDLGGFASAGYVADHSDSVRFITSQGVKVGALDKFMAALSHAVKQPLPQDLSRSQTLLALGIDESADSNRRLDGKFAHLYAHQRSYTQGPTTSKETVKIATALSVIGTMQGAVELVCKSIIEKVASLLVVPAADLSPSRRIAHYGADSLIAVQPGNWIAVHLQTEVQMLELLGTASIHQFSATVASRCKVAPAFSTPERD